MSVEELGRKLLEEVEETNLHELLDELRTTLPPSTSPSHPFNLPQLDHIINILLAPSSTSTTTSVPSPTRQSPLKPRTLRLPSIELTSLAPGAGKTHLIYHLLARCVVGTPEHKPAAAILLDTDGRFSVSRLAEVVERYIVSIRDGASTDNTTTNSDVGPSVSNRLDDTNANDTSNPTSPSTAERLHTALQHIHVFRPQSLASLISTLHSLPDYLLGTGTADGDGNGESVAHYSSNRRVGLIVLDSASAFFWQERMAEEVVRVGGVVDGGDVVGLGGSGGAGGVPAAAVEKDGEVGDGRQDEAEAEAGRGVSGDQGGPNQAHQRRQQPPTQHSQAPNQDLASALHATQTLLSAPLIYTTITLSSSFSPNSNPSNPSTTSTNPAPALSILPPHFATCRLLLSRDAVKKFPPQLSLAALQADAAARLAVVAEGKARATVLPGHGRNEDVRRRIAGDGRARGFAFAVGREGVRFV